MISAVLRKIAYEKLGVTEEVVLRGPQIRRQLAMMQKTLRGSGQPVVRMRMLRGAGPAQETTRTPAPYGPGSDLTHAWPNYLEASIEPDALRVRDVFYSLPAYLRRLLPIEAFCAAAGVSPPRIIEILTATLVRQGVEASRIIAAVNHPRVVQKTVEMALTDDGIADREILHKHAGFLPTPQGPSTSVIVTQNASAQATAQAATVPVISPEATIRRLADRFNTARALPQAASVEPMPVVDTVEAEFDEVERDDVRRE